MSPYGASTSRPLIRSLRGSQARLECSPPDAAGKIVERSVLLPPLEPAGVLDNRQIRGGACPVQRISDDVAPASVRPLPGLLERFAAERFERVPDLRPPATQLVEIELARMGASRRVESGGGVTQPLIAVHG